MHQPRGDATDRAVALAWDRRFVVQQAVGWWLYLALLLSGIVQ